MSPASSIIPAFTVAVTFLSGFKWSYYLQISFSYFSASRIYILCKVLFVFIISFNTRFGSIIVWSLHAVVFHCVSDQHPSFLTLQCIWNFTIGRHLSYLRNLLIMFLNIDSSSILRTQSTIPLYWIVLCLPDTSQSHLKRRHLNWENAWVACEQACVAFPWQMINVEGFISLWVLVPTLGW